MLIKTILINFHGGDFQCVPNETVKNYLFFAIFYFIVKVLVIGSSNSKSFHAAFSSNSDS
jgi:hypothetical protein